MLLSLDSLINQYNLDIKGIIHCGAHTAEEYPIYQRLNINNVLWIEGNEDLIPILEHRIRSDKHLLLHAVIGERPLERVDFIYTNQTQSSSLYQLGNNKHQRKGLEVAKIKQVEAVSLDYLFSHHIDLNINNYNMINLDIQGGELKALIGFKNHLKYIDYIYTEVHIGQTYKDVPQLQDLINFLTPLDFEIKDKYIYKKKGWGDVLFIKKPKT